MEGEEEGMGGEVSLRCLPLAPGCKKDKGGMEDKGRGGGGRGEREEKEGVVVVVTFSSRMYLGTL